MPEPDRQERGPWTRPSRVGASSRHLRSEVRPELPRGCGSAEGGLLGRPGRSCVPCSPFHPPTTEGAVSTVSESEQRGWGSERHQEPAAELGPESVTLQEVAGRSHVRGPQNRRVHGDRAVSSQGWGTLFCLGRRKVAEMASDGSQGCKCNSASACALRCGQHGESYVTCISPNANRKGSSGQGTGRNR